MKKKTYILIICSLIIILICVSPYPVSEKIKCLIASLIGWTIGYLAALLVIWLRS